MEVVLPPDLGQSGIMTIQLGQGGWETKSSFCGAVLLLLCIPSSDDSVGTPEIAMSKQGVARHVHSCYVLPPITSVLPLDCHFN